MFVLDWPNLPWSNIIPSLFKMSVNRTSGLPAVFMETPRTTWPELWLSVRSRNLIPRPARKVTVLGQQDLSIFTCAPEHQSLEDYITSGWCYIVVQPALHPGVCCCALYNIVVGSGRCHWRSHVPSLDWDVAQYPCCWENSQYSMRWLGSKQGTDNRQLGGTL